MKRRFTLFLLFCFAVVALQAQTRYLDEVFTDVVVQSDVVYGQNYTIINFPINGGRTEKEDLLLDIYTPDGDTETNRPLILAFHTGNFLPQLLNGQINGTKTDPYFVNMVQRLTRLGYVVASVEYRQGWDPLNPEADARKGTLLNAAYRGIQDASTAVRFFRKSAIDDGNPYGIDPSKIATFGVGTGSYIALGQGYIDSYLDIAILPKFIGPDINMDMIPDPYVIQAFNGDPWGEELLGQNPLNGDTLALPNTPGYSNDVQLIVTLGGALADTSWIDDDDPPLISFQVPNDPFAPFLEDFLIVPTTGETVVRVTGAGVNVPLANELGINDVFSSFPLWDPYTERANELNDGNDGLFPMNRPTWDLDMDGTPETPESSPWDWWDVATWSTEPLGQALLDGPGQFCEGAPIEACNWHIISLAGNPDMSIAKGTAYLDTIVGYFAPRACMALNLEGCIEDLTNTEEILEDQSLVSISPNPASSRIEVKSDNDLIVKLEILDVSGKVILRETNINKQNIAIDNVDALNGIHFIKTYFEQGVLTKKVIFQ